jgi:hypothetical protein
MRESRLANFFAFVLAVRRHVVALIAGILGGVIVSSPAWIRPMLSARHQADLDDLTRWTAQPNTYALIAFVFFFGCVSYACFLAWEEEHIERTTLEERQSRPQFAGEVRPHSMWGSNYFEARILLRNVGLVPSLAKDWTLWIPSMNMSLGSGPILRRPLPTPAPGQSRLVPPELTPKPAESPVVRDDTRKYVAIDPGHGEEFWIRFPLTLSLEELKGVATEIRFFDVRNDRHSIPWTFP